MIATHPCVEDSAVRIKLPEPDLKNITVLTSNLPNSPILPWNHYDSPWLDEKETARSAEENSQAAE
ncbi:hypothetical protein C7B61_08060 [filamentous cyanobacterium CCP1]|nr:hypothetical protein C7B76_03465 [filamentous cyanobacterium CCP2]PSB67076.1 hypothetical protein C7B61_08060 [filamentous cyanobacterium CCP1]